MLTIELPYPPSVNRYYRHVGFRTLISREGRAYRRLVCAILRRAGVRPLDGTLAVGIDLYPPDRRTRDADNVQKALLDAMQHGGVYHDDSQIKKLLTINAGHRRGWRQGNRLCPPPGPLNREGHST